MNEKVTPVKYLNSINCGTCGKILEDTKDRYRLFGGQELYKTLEIILEGDVISEYVCSSGRSKLQRFSRILKEKVEITEFFKGMEYKCANYQPQALRFKRGRITPPNASVNVSHEEPTTMPKAQRSIDFNQQLALFPSSFPLSSSSSIAGSTFTSTSPPTSTILIAPESASTAAISSDKSTQTSNYKETNDLKASKREERIEVR
jgi:hypothetical protein